MMPYEHLIEEGHEVKTDSGDFMRKVTLKLLNIIIDSGLPTHDCNFLGNNDLLLYRGTNVVIVCFSRSRYLVKPFFSEYELKEYDKDEKNLTVTKAEFFDSEGLQEHEMYQKLKDPIKIVFPVSYLKSDTEDGGKQKHEEIAKLLLKPTQDDIDKKRRLVKVNPIFQGRSFLLEENLCFVLMPFEEPYTQIYEKIIKPSVEAEGFKIVKSDDIFSTKSVIEDIWENINKASLIIAEISDNNPNVMYELGICHTIGKDVMMITQNPENIPFNFRHMRTYPYENDITKADELKANISSMIKYIKSTQKTTEI